MISLYMIACTLYCSVKILGRLLLWWHSTTPSQLRINQPVQVEVCNQPTPGQPYRWTPRGSAL